MAVPPRRQLSGRRLATSRFTWDDVPDTATIHTLRSAVGSEPRQGTPRAMAGRCDVAMGLITAAMPQWPTNGPYKLTH